MSDEHPPTDAPAPDASPEKIARAVASYELVAMLLNMITRAVDADGAAKNYAQCEITLDGFKLPFDRAMLTFMRPGGLTPHQRAEGMSALLDEARADTRLARRRLEVLEARASILSARLRDVRDELLRLGALDVAKGIDEMFEAIGSGEPTPHPAVAKLVEVRGQLQECAGSRDVDNVIANIDGFILDVEPT